MTGPAAPKDPEKRRPFFYIMRDKEVFGAKQPDGKGIQFIYENDGRLINSAQISGNITDQQMLDLLKTTEGFRKLVHSIGVTVEAEDRQETVLFEFQMYANKDVYGGGSVLSLEVPGDGMEKKLKLSEVNWRPDDKEPGQIRFTFQTPEKLGKVSVRLYLNDGFQAPEVIEDIEVDVTSDAYKNMICRSLMQTGNGVRLMRTIERARAGEDVTLAYIGGSVTQGAGATPINKECYAYKSYQAFANAFGTGENVHYVKAGVGGTPSELGMLRFERDILRDGVNPDIVVVEFAVNDEGDETKGKCFESLIKKILLLPNHPAVVILFAVFANDWNLAERLSPVGHLYDLPMVNVLDAVSPQFGLKKEDGRVLSKNQYFYDIYHPSNLGHTIMSDCLMNLFEKAGQKLTDLKNVIPEDPTLELLKQSPAIGNEFTNVKLIDKKCNMEACELDEGGFVFCDTELQSVELDENLFGTPEFPYNWMYDGTKERQENAYLSVRLKARAFIVIIKDSGAVDAGKANLYVDGELVRTADPHENGWVHCNPLLVLNEMESKEHEIRVEVVKGDEEKKFTVLGFGYVE